MPKVNNIAIFGLGAMGYGIASSILKAGHQVWGFDVVASSVERFVSEGGKSASVKVVGPKIDTAVVVVLNAVQLESVLFGDNGIVQHMEDNSCVIACPTVAPDFAREMAARCSEYNVLYLDAPISGGTLKAAAGQLSIMASGSDDAFLAAKPAFNAMAENVFEIDAEPGAGSAMKAINQLMAGVHIATMGEAMTFGMTQGVAPEQIVKVISQCAGTSWMFENRAPHIVEGDYTPHSAINIWLKDLGIVLDIAKDAKFSAPLTAAALQHYIAAAGIGLGNEDDAAIAKVYARNADLKLPGES